MVEPRDGRWASLPRGWGKAPAIHDTITRDRPHTRTRFARRRLGTAVVGEDDEAEAGGFVVGNWGG